MANSGEKPFVRLSASTLLGAYGLKPKKSLGQNFLASPATGEMLADRMEITGEDTVLEIGAGLGALTFPMASRAKFVHAVETDGRLCPILQEQAAALGLSNVAVVCKDILSTRLSDFSEGEPLVVAGNLPYHISSPVLAWLVAQRSLVKRAYLMFQKELARRILAKPGGKDYSRISVLAAYASTVTPLADLDAERFYPRPKVKSRALAFDFDKPGFADPEAEQRFFKTVEAAFSTRRKALRNALAHGGAAADPKQAEAALKAAGIDPSRRAETLDIDEFMRLSTHVGRVSGRVKPNPNYS
ncbi:MAG: ribosomal RNA small subunit methyltransferase A [Deltaproteobacteria bacterium]|nr:ribosomal RNA small subunit methyltransferase A [Deltaproteobacteria bacterium]